MNAGFERQRQPVVRQRQLGMNAEAGRHEAFRGRFVIDADAAQPRLEGLNLALDFLGDAGGDPRLAQGQVVKVGQPPVGAGLGAAGPAVQVEVEVANNRRNGRGAVRGTGRLPLLGGDKPLEQGGGRPGWGNSVVGAAPYQVVSSRLLSDRVKSAPIYLKWGWTMILARYQPTSPSTSSTSIRALRRGRRLRTSAEGFSWSET